MAKPNSLHLQIETCYIVDFSEGFSIQSTDVATFRSFIYTFFFLLSPWVESVLSYDFYPEIWGTSCAQGQLHTEAVIPCQKRDIGMSSIRDTEKGKDQLDLSGLS